MNKKMIKRIFAGTLAAIVLSTTAAFAAIEDTGFTDVNSDDWFAPAVKYVTETSIMRRTGVTKFSPNEYLSRELLSVILFRMSDDAPVETNIEFEDVMPGRWYRNGVLWAAEKGIFSGYGNGIFGSGDGITREQFATVMWRYAGKPTPQNNTLTFTDADKISDWAKEAVTWANENNIMIGMSGGDFVPQRFVTRAEAASSIMGAITDKKVIPESKAKVIISEAEEAEYIERVKLTINGTDNEAIVKLIDSKPTREFISQLPMTVEFSDFGAREKFASMPMPLTETEALLSGYEPGEFLYGTPYKCMIAFYKQDGEIIDGLIKLGDFESGIEYFSNPENISVTIEAIE